VHGGTVRGIGQALMENAVYDAVRVSWRAYHIRHVDMPATPARVWAAIAEGRRLHTL